MFCNEGFNTFNNNSDSGFGHNHRCSCNHHCGNGVQFRPVRFGEVIHGDINIRRGLRDLQRAAREIELGLLEMEDGVGFHFRNCNLRHRHGHNHIGDCIDHAFSNSRNNIFGDL